MSQLSTTQYLANITHNDEADIKSFFSLFGVDSKFSAHQNIINSLNDLLICPVNSDIFHSLIEYQKLSSWLTSFSKINLSLVGSAGKKFNAVPRVGTSPRCITTGN